MTAAAENPRHTLLKSLNWRPIGPLRGGRVIAVAGDPANDQIFYFGSTGGGVWKTTDGGQYWENVSDGYFKRASVGSLVVAPSDPNVIYVGMGEATIRGNVSHGDGVYKSSDAGKTWVHCGLEDTRNIGQLRVHPSNPDIVYVAALGHAHGPNRERGVYRSTDGGKTWDQILFQSEKAGAIDIAMAPSNPRILYASFWEAKRTPHSLISGGDDSALYKSIDSGDTWTALTHANGLPKTTIGKIELAVSHAQEDRVWAMVEADEGGVFRTDDGGVNWERINDDRNLRQRAWYYSHIIADPQDADTVWVLNVSLWKSTDGGKTFVDVPTPHGDNHDLWIDPENPQRMIEGNDGGACVSFNGGASWSSIYNQQTSEFYHVITDNEVPYRVYGAQQDNTTITTVSRSAYPAITNWETFPIGGGESGYIAIKPDDSNIIFAGSYGGLLTRFDRRTGQTQNVQVWPEPTLGWAAQDMKYRFQWTFPIVYSLHEKNTLFTAGNHLFKSTDEGMSWKEISPDLTRAEPHTLEPSGGPITKDNTGAETYATIFAFAESPIKQGVYWAGSDDGLIHVSRNGGKKWSNVTPKELPEWALISIIEASSHNDGTAYVAATRYKSDDFAPYLLKTTNYGKSWSVINNGIPESEFTRVIREDPTRPGLLYAGTEAGLYVSFNDGKNWDAMTGNFPVVPVHDLVVKGDELVIGTHGRSFWILDDLTPVRTIAELKNKTEAHLFSPKDTIRFRTAKGFGSSSGNGKNFHRTGAGIATYKRVKDENGEEQDVNLDAGHNPPDGVVVHYYLKEAPEELIKLTFTDRKGNELRSFTSKVKDDSEEKKEPRVSSRAGMNQFVWDMRYAPAMEIPDDASMGMMRAGAQGPLAVPGTYKVTLTAGKQSFTESFEIQKDPRVSATQDDLEAQLELALKLRDKLTETHEAILRIRRVREQINTWLGRVKDQDNAKKLVESGEKIKEDMTGIEANLAQVKAKSIQDVLNYPIMLNAKLAGLAGVVNSADARPTSQSYEVYDVLSARGDDQIGKLDNLLKSDAGKFNKLVEKQGIPPISIE